MRHTINVFLALAAFWLLNSGHNSALMLSLGVVSITLVLYIVHRMDRVDHESNPVHRLQRLPGYFVWLFKELVRANIVVVKHIWLGNDSISPTLATISASQKTDLGKVIFANSISMTPGTVTVDLVGDRVMVHALLRESIQTLNNGEMDRRVSRLEKEC